MRRAAGLAVALVAACGGGPERRPALDASLPAAPDAALPRPAPPPRPDAAVPEPAPPGMARVPAGPFLMGADAGGEEDEHPAHTVTLPAFWLDVTEVTNAAYDACTKARVCRPRGPRASHPGPTLPVTGVSWDDARAYCAWVGKRLPREAEFEKAARGPRGQRFAWGEAPPTRALTVAMGEPHPAPVGSRPAGRGPYGHDDLAGNVWEWMEDLYDPIAYRRPGAPTGQPGTCDEILRTQEALRRAGKQGFTGSNPIPTTCERVLRGGAYNYPADGLRASNRVHHPGTWRIKVAGFRCARDCRSL